MANKSYDSKLSRSIETLNLLREYAQDANRNFEDQRSDFEYLNKMQKIKDFPRRARLVLNNNVPAEFHINDDELKTLHHLVEEYDFD